MGRIAAVAALSMLALLAPESARADWTIARAQAIAAVAWHNPCDGDVRLVWAAIPRDRAAEAGGCVITFQAGSDSQGWGEVCLTMLHEYGHLANYNDPLNPSDPWHSHSENSVMHDPIIVSSDTRCRDHGRPYLEASGFLTPHSPLATRSRNGRSGRWLYGFHRRNVRRQIRRAVRAAR